MDVLVVGAGIFGVTSAIELCERRHRVTLVDPGPVPHPDASSTDISKVVRLDYGADAFYTELMEEALPGWRSQFVSLFHETGFAVISSGPMQPESFELESYELLRARGHAVERLDAHEIARRFPAFRPGRYQDGYYNPEGGWAESGRVVEALAERALSLGVTMRQGVAIERLADDGVLTKSGERIAAECTLVTAGAWTPALVPELADRIRCVGQPVLHFQPSEPSVFAFPSLTVWAADIARTGWYGFPLHPSARVVKIAHHGRGEELDPRTERGDATRAEPRFRAFLADSMPALADAPLVHSRTCFYCDTFDGDFFIGRHPERPRLVVAAGGSGHAFKFAPVLGGIVADTIEGVPNRWAQRFAWRERSTARAERARSDGPS
jgi:glycine/D-amino acid oxidase-like deaminating enzyme